MTFPRSRILGESLSRQLFCRIGIAIGLAFCFSLSLQSQVSPANRGNALNVVFYPAPPANFNPAAASDEELALYGFPPRPDPGEATPFAHWLKMVSTPQVRITHPQLEQTAIYNGVAKGWNEGKVVNGITNTTSTNWSGFAVNTPNNTFTVNNSRIYMEFIVPIAQQAFHVCSGDWVYSSQWVGFDGVTSNDVLQAGSEADDYCSGGSNSPFYSLWYEWFPNPEVRISLPIAPGNMVAVEVWYTTSAPYGHAYWVNYSTQVSTTLAFNPPGGTTYVGNSAEWIEERPGVNGGLANLTNYVGNPFTLDYAYNGQYYYPGSSPAGTTTYNITMVCPPWNPSSSCTNTTNISKVELSGLYALWFYDEGPAF